MLHWRNLHGTVIERMTAPDRRLPKNMHTAPSLCSGLTICASTKDFQTQYLLPSMLCQDDGLISDIICGVSGHHTANWVIRSDAERAVRNYSWPRQLILLVDESMPCC